ncbi:MAG: methyl-accepting chemotaxis protein [Butyrivibrio sp.]|nr:methyl-accepting chemotaxis protein [Butyrivibrio sp.]
MRSSIKLMVAARVIAALISIFLFSGVTTQNISKIKRLQTSDAETAALLNRVQTAETAHYKWSANLSNALNAGTEFTGSTDPTGCVLGQWLYGEADSDDSVVSELRSKLEPLHKELHQSAVYVLELLETEPQQARDYYQQTILSNLTVLVGYMDEVVEHEQELSAESKQHINDTIGKMYIMCIICLAIALLCMISLIQYVFAKVVRPIVRITDSSRPLKEGKLKFDLSYKARNELGDLAETLGESMSEIHGYVEDLTRIMEQFSNGNFDVATSKPYIGDFHSIEQALNRFTSTLSTTISSIYQAERRVSGHAEMLSNGAQSLAQGATEQAGSVKELYDTLEELSRTAEHNVRVTSEASENARLTGEQVAISGRQMEEMVKAMEDIRQSSHQINNIIATIENIAFQINILSLNAAVEAARAGTAGKGFAVVAEEVGNLAAKSDESAKATKKLIENSVSVTERGGRIVEEVSETLNRTLELVLKSNGYISSISEAVQGEAESIAQVTTGISQISAVVEMNSASSEETAAVSAELFEQVHVLEEQTKKFKLRRR